jgi:hypothetical protein
MVKCLLFMRPIHVWRSRTRLSAFGAHTFLVHYHNKNRSESIVVEIVGLTWVEYHVAEPKFALSKIHSSSNSAGVPVLPGHWSGSKESSNQLCQVYVPGSLDIKRRRRFHLSSIFCLIRGSIFFNKDYSIIFLNMVFPGRICCGYSWPMTGFSYTVFC